MTEPTRDQLIQEALARRTPPQHRSGFFDAVEAELTQASPAQPKTDHRWTRPRWFAGIATPVAAALLVGVLLFNTQQNPPQAPPQARPAPPVDNVSPTSVLDNAALAASVVRKAEETYASVTGVSGTIKRHEFAFSEGDAKITDNVEVTQFRVSSRGDSWTSLACQNGQGVEVNTYVAATGESRSDGGPVGCRGKDDTFPDGRRSIYTSSEDGHVIGQLGELSLFSSFVRALASAKNPKLDEVQYDGRPAWRLDVNAELDQYGFTADHFEITVDKATSFPVHLFSTRKGKPFAETSVNDLKVNPAFGPSDFTIKFPKGVNVDTGDGGYKRISLSKVRAEVGYEPFILQYIPEGFALSTVSANKDAGRGGAEGANEINKNLVSLVYRRGLNTVVITTRSSERNDTYPSGDPYSYEGEPSYPKDVVKLQDGAFKGLTANLVTKSTTDPHVWVQGSRWVLTVSGDLTREELIKVAESMAQQSIQQ